MSELPREEEEDSYVDEADYYLEDQKNFYLLTAKYAGKDDDDAGGASDASNIFVPIGKRGPPFNDFTKQIGYSRGLYDRFLKINFADDIDLLEDDRSGGRKRCIDVSSLGFTICEETQAEKVALTKNMLQIKEEEICFGQDIKEIIKCQSCKNVACEPIKECSACQLVYCGKCIQINQACQNCNLKKQFKNMNRIAKQLALSKLRFKHVCRPSALLDQHVLDGLEQYFGVIDPTSELMYVLLYELNVKEGLSVRTDEMEACIDALTERQKVNRRKLKYFGLWPTKSSHGGTMSIRNQIQQQSQQSPPHQQNNPPKRKLQKLCEYQTIPHINEQIKSKEEKESQQDSRYSNNDHLEPDKQNQKQSDNYACEPKKMNKRELKARKKQNLIQDADQCETQMIAIRVEFWRQVEEMRPKILTYDDYIKHVQNECYNYRPYVCCEQNTMNIHEYKYHLMHECQKMQFKCQTCEISCKRNEIKAKHEVAECLDNLKKEYEDLKSKQVEQTNEELKKQIKELKEKQESGNAGQDRERRGAGADVFDFIESSSESSSQTVTITRMANLSTHQNFQRNLSRMRPRNSRIGGAELRDRERRFYNSRVFRQQLRRREMLERERRHQREQLNNILARDDNNNGEEDALSY